MKKVTSKDVAEYAKVSQATVSLILNNSQKVTFSDETVERVFAAAKELGYRLPSRDQKRKFSHRLMLFIPTLTNYYYTELVQYAQSYAFLRGYNVTICNTFRNSDIERLFLNQSKDVDGIIYTFIPSFPNLVEQIAQSIPVVMIGEKKENLGICSIELSNHIAASLLADHLYERGHRKFLFLSTPLSRFSLSREQRLQGLRKTFERRGLNDAITVISPEASSEREISVSADSYEFQSGRRMMAETLEKGLEASITAIICVNDMTAYGAMVALKQHGIRIPQDVSLCGFDNIMPSCLTTPTLTSVDHHLKERCKSAIDMVIQRYENDAEATVNKIEYTPRLIVRGSTDRART